GPGHTCCLVLPNLPEFPVAFLGVLASGGRCVTANPLYTARELTHQLADTHASLVITTATTAGVAHEAADPLGEEVVLVDEGPRQGGLLADAVRSEATDVDPRAVAAILYSGGTTGLPKGVMLTHRNLVASIIQTAPVLDLTPDDVVLAPLPFFHVYGLNV